MVEYRTDSRGRRRRVHKEYVDVVCRLTRDGAVEPVTVMWRDGRCFTVDEVLEYGCYGEETRGVRQARYRVRFGGHETDLYLERRDAVDEVGEPEDLRWWVFAYDRALPAEGRGK